MTKSQHILAQQIISNPNKEFVQTAISNIGLSRRRIEQRFIAATGLNIGTFTRKIRFQQVLQLLEKKNDGDIFCRICLNAGFYDQSHFINEFKDFTSITPYAFFLFSSLGHPH